MDFTVVPLTTVTAVPPTSTTLHGFSPATCLCTVPFGQNSSVGAVPNVTSYQYIPASNTVKFFLATDLPCLLYTSPSPRD